MTSRKRRYLKLIHDEYFIGKKDAEAREKFLKSGYGHQQLREILKRTLQEIKRPSVENDKAILP